VEGCGRTASLAEAEKDLDALGPPADRLTDTGGPLMPTVGGAVLALLAAVALAARSLRRD
jgi:hypothetical protein